MALKLSSGAKQSEDVLIKLVAGSIKLKSLTLEGDRLCISIEGRLESGGIEPGGQTQDAPVARVGNTQASEFEDLSAPVGDFTGETVAIPRALAEEAGKLIPKTACEEDGEQVPSEPEPVESVGEEIGEKVSYGRSSELADTKSAEESAPSPVLYDIGEGDSPESVKAPEPKREEKSFGVNFSKERVFIPHKLDETVAMDHFTPVKPEDFAAEKEIESSADDEATTEGGLPIDLSPTAEIKPLSADNPGGVRYGEPEKDPDVYGQQPGTSPYDAPAANSAPTKPVSAGAPKSSPENDVTTGMHKSYVRFTCRKCGTKSVVDVDAAKEVVTCKNCGKAMRLKLKNG